MAKLLIIADYADDTGLLGRDVTALGHKVASTRDPSAALAVAGSECPDAILLALRGPGAVGVETCRRLKSEERLAPIPIVLVASPSDADLIAAGLDAGAQSCVGIPFKPEVLAAHVRAALRVRESHERLARTAASRLVARDDFLFHVSHELRTPLGVVYQFVTNMADGLAGDVTAEQHECLEIVLRNVGQMKAMIRDLIEVTRIGTGKLRIEPRPIEISSVVGEVLTAVREAAATKQLTMIAELPGDMPAAFADQTRVRQILSNLVDNALKFTPPRGVVTVRGALTGAEAKLVRVTVEDTGCGMEPEAALRIFERLYQAPGRSTSARKGLGLGLYIARELVVRQGGTIWVDSRPGQGSAFSFTLPACRLDRVVSATGEMQEPRTGADPATVSFA